MLLLTEELIVPWELAAFEPELTSAWGGESPFLGAHAAVSRWPLTSTSRGPQPRSSVAVRTGAVLTADYTGVSDWGRLESALAEAGEVAPSSTHRHAGAPRAVGRHRPVQRQSAR